MKLPKILIIGPVGDIGGRELETGFIANALRQDFNVQIISTGNFTSKSQIFDFVSKTQMISLNQLVVKRNIMFYSLMLLAYFKSLCRGSVKDYASNEVSKRLGFKSFAIKQLQQLIDENELVFLCAQTSSNYLKEVIEYAHKKSKPIVLRTSNTIKHINNIDYSWLEKVSLFIHHSLSNANRLNALTNYEYKIIDQCSFKEDDLLAIKPVKKIEKLLYIGRLSQEKGILDFVEHFKNIHTNLKLLIIGDGAQYEVIKEAIKDVKNIELLGYLNQDEILKYIAFSDAVIIPSYEESGPLVGLEAMASARIVISTKVGAMMDRLKECKNQFWVNINDPISLQNVLDYLSKLKQEEIEQIAIQNRERYLAHYTKAKIERQYKNAIIRIFSFVQE